MTIRKTRHVPVTAARCAASFSPQISLEEKVMRVLILAITFAATTLLSACTIEPAQRQAAPTPTPVDEVAAHPTPTPEPTPEPTPSPTPEPTPEPTPTPEPAFAGADWLERGRLSVLLAGTDPGFYHDGSRTDAMMVASVDLDTGYVAIFGIPRSFTEITLPDHIADVLGYRTYSAQINGLYRVGENNPGLFPDAVDAGMHILEGAVEELLDVPIDYYATVDMQGFVDVVDAFGGVEVNVRQPVHVRLLNPDEEVGWQEFNIQPGEQTLDGRHALAYARSRSGSTDYDRMERQRCIVASAIDQADLPTLLRTFPDLVEAIQNNVVANVPMEQLPDMVMLRDEISSDRIISIGLDPPRYSAGETDRGHHRPDYSAIQETVQQVFADPGSYLDGERADLLDDRHC
jgi:polyisoprenyl-teichoic acid--peptidoglycan teichoic acid transferase